MGEDEFVYLGIELVCCAADLCAPVSDTVKIILGYCTAGLYRSNRPRGRSRVYCVCGLT